MAGIATHYDVLGVDPAAAEAEVRAAYRRLARVTHPDTAGDAAANSMARLNEAWRVLSDPARRAVYDASLRPPSASSGFDQRFDQRLDEELHPVASRPEVRSGRFPIWPIVGLTVVGAALMFVFSASSKPETPAGPDWKIETGSCVTVVALDAIEVGCGSAHDGVVRQLVAFDTSCPIDTRTYRDHQGLGNVCVTPAGA